MSKVAHLLITPLVQKRRVNVSVGAGAFRDSLVTVAEVMGRVEPLNRRSQKDLLAGQTVSEITHAIYLEPYSDVRVNDEYHFEGRVMRVVDPNFTPSVAIYKKSHCVEIQGA